LTIKKLWFLQKFFDLPVSKYLAVLQQNLDKHLQPRHNKLEQGRCACFDPSFPYYLYD